jgi:hypothetical protein
MPDAIVCHQSNARAHNIAFYIIQQPISWQCADVYEGSWCAPPALMGWRRFRSFIPADNSTLGEHHLRPIVRMLFVELQKTKEIKNDAKPRMGLVIETDFAEICLQLPCFSQLCRDEGPDSEHTWSVTLHKVWIA